jgi:hypothetical protein
LGRRANEVTAIRSGETAGVHSVAWLAVHLGDVVGGPVGQEVVR